MKAVSPGWFGSCFPLFCLTEQTGPGRQGEEREGLRAQKTSALSPHLTPAAGWVARLPAVPREAFFFLSFFFFFFFLCRQNRGQLLLSEALCPPPSQTVLDLPASASLSAPSPTVTRSHSPCICLLRQISWGCAAFFCFCFFCFFCQSPGELTDVQPEEEKTFVSVARQRSFLLPLRRRSRLSERACVCVCV